MQQATQWSSSSRHCIACCLCGMCSKAEKKKTLAQWETLNLTTLHSPKTANFSPVTNTAPSKKEGRSECASFVGVFSARPSPAFVRKTNSDRSTVHRSAVRRSTVYVNPSPVSVYLVEVAFLCFWVSFQDHFLTTMHRAFQITEVTSE